MAISTWIYHSSPVKGLPIVGNRLRAPGQLVGGARNNLDSHILRSLEDVVLALHLGVGNRNCGIDRVKPSTWESRPLVNELVRAVDDLVFAKINPNGVRSWEEVRFSRGAWKIDCGVDSIERCRSKALPFVGNLEGPSRRVSSPPGLNLIRITRAPKKK